VQCRKLAKTVDKLAGTLENLQNAKLGSNGGKYYTKIMAISKGMEQRK
jgi:hypothetical protein